jgi:hypothetical protein
MLKNDFLTMRNLFFNWVATILKISRDFSVILKNMALLGENKWRFSA